MGRSVIIRNLYQLLKARKLRLFTKNILILQIRNMKVSLIVAFILAFCMVLIQARKWMPVKKEAPVKKRGYGGGYNSNPYKKICKNEPGNQCEAGKYMETLIQVDETGPEANTLSQWGLNWGI